MIRFARRMLEPFRIAGLSDAQLAAVIRHPGSTRRLVTLALREQDIRDRAADITRPPAAPSRPGSMPGVGECPGATAEPGGVNVARPS